MKINCFWDVADYTAQHPRRQSSSNCEISDSHRGEYEDRSFLGYSVV
jgi:hypothetical protein